MCTIFRYKNDSSHFIGKNYDVSSPCYGLIFWNPAGKKKKALIKPPEEPVEWLSKFGNITFNQVGRDFPSSGMNEKGLIVEQTTLWNTTYPDKDKRKAIKELQLIQYILDVCSNTKEVLESIEKVRISQEMAKLQYVISDSSGDICLIEFILGKMEVYSNNDFPYQVITNDMIKTSVDYLNAHTGYGGSKSLQYSKYSLDRYAITVDALHKNLSSEKNLNAFELLNLSKYEDTQWQIIFDLKTMNIKWRTKSGEIIKELLLTDFINKKECITIEMETNKLSAYTNSRNLKLVSRFFKERIYFREISISDSDIVYLASYPEKSSDI